METIYAQQQMKAYRSDVHCYLEASLEREITNQVEASLMCSRIEVEMWAGDRIMEMCLHHSLSCFIVGECGEIERKTERKTVK